MAPLLGHQIVDSQARTIHETTRAGSIVLVLSQQKAKRIDQPYSFGQKLFPSLNRGVRQGNLAGLQIAQAAVN